MGHCHKRNELPFKRISFFLPRYNKQATTTATTPFHFHQKKGGPTNVETTANVPFHRLVLCVVHNHSFKDKSEEKKRNGTPKRGVVNKYYLEENEADNKIPHCQS